MAIDAKIVLTFEKRPLVAELKLKPLKIAHSLTLSISALPPEGAFQMLPRFVLASMATWPNKSLCHCVPEIIC